MDFSLSDDHLALRDAVQRFCDGEYPAHERGNAETPERAAQRHAGMAELGLLGLPFAAGLGGSDQGTVEGMLVAQELGRSLAGNSWLPNVTLAGPLLAEAGSATQQARWLPALAAGRLHMALAVEEPDARYDAADVQTTARARADGWVLDGHKSGVLGGDTADLLLVLARTNGARRDRDGLTLFALDADAPGLHRRPYTTLDARGAAHLRLQGVAGGAAEVVGPVGGALPHVERALDRANAALCAEAAGALEALLALTTEHLRTRRQFGAPLSTFQALQHQVADLAIALEQVKSMACVASLSMDDADATTRAYGVSAAKALTARLGRAGALAAIQLHGAMGMTDECRAGHYAKRLIAIGQMFGDAGFHLRRVAARHVQMPHGDNA
jgi:alkylation response protein AidB-like acyl-CoA dehydrogenase